MSKHASLRRAPRTMESILRQGILARNQALKRERLRSEREYKKEWKEQWRTSIYRGRLLANQGRAERQARREDWAMGPLAPRRTVGEQRDLYGVSESLRMQMPKIPESDRRKYINIAVGDRVAVVRGRGRGKIGVVKTVSAEDETVVVKGVNPIDVGIPGFAAAQEADTRPYRQYEEPIPLDGVRLVVPMTRKGSDETRDVVIRHLRGGEPIIERAYGDPTPTHTRYIQSGDDPSLDIEIPWPPAEQREETDEPIDTLRMQVEHVTLEPSIIHEPMPASVLDELRDPYGRTRNRFDEAFANEKKLLDMKNIWLKRQRLVSPLTEYMEKQQRERAKEAPRGLAEETLHLIRETQAEAAVASSTQGTQQHLDPHLIPSVQGQPSSAPGPA